MTRRAARTDANQPEIVKALRDAGASVAITAGLGNGFPDLVVGFRGKTTLLEVKTPDELRRPALGLTPKEREFHRDWNGGALFVVANPEMALNSIGAEGYKA